MFQPSQADVRRFFCGAYAKARAGQPMEAIELLASQWIDEHPEYHAELADVDAALAAMQTSTPGRENPFLHLAMHLSISEQCSIDQPRGIRQAVELLAARRDSLHAAHHEAMDCLGTMLQDSQRSGRPPDGHNYIACVQRQATRD
jgi:ATP/maltotriose-dependent transcriptional regulator MalT